MQFYFLLIFTSFIHRTVIALTVLLVIVASFYESSLQHKGYVFDEKKIETKHQSKIDNNNFHGFNNNNNNNENFNVNGTDKYEMNQISQNDGNNNMDENDKMQIKGMEKIYQTNEEKNVKNLGGYFLKICF